MSMTDAGMTFGGSEGDEADLPETLHICPQAFCGPT
jgi:hypothetical protein